MMYPASSEAEQREHFCPGFTFAVFPLLDHRAFHGVRADGAVNKGLGFELHWLGTSLLMVMSPSSRSLYKTQVEDQRIVKIVSESHGSFEAKILPTREDVTLNCLIAYEDRVSFSRAGLAIRRHGEESGVTICRQPVRVFDTADQALGFSLTQLCFEGPAEELQLTENTQPALLTVSVAACRVLQEQGLRPDYVAGHSLGEYSALVAAGSLDFADAVRLVRKRGQLHAGGGSAGSRRHGGACSSCRRASWTPF